MRKPAVAFIAFVAVLQLQPQPGVSFAATSPQTATPSPSPTPAPLIIELIDRFGRFFEVIIHPVPGHNPGTVIPTDLSLDPAVDARLEGTPLHGARVGATYAGRGRLRGTAISSETLTAMFRNAAVARAVDIGATGDRLTSTCVLWDIRPATPSPSASPSAPRDSVASASPTADPATLVPNRCAARGDLLNEFRDVFASPSPTASPSP